MCTRSSPSTSDDTSPAISAGNARSSHSAVHTPSDRNGAGFAATTSHPPRSQPFIPVSVSATVLTCAGRGNRATSASVASTASTRRPSHGGGHVAPERSSSASTGAGPPLSHPAASARTPPALRCRTRAPCAASRSSSASSPTSRNADFPLGERATSRNAGVYPPPAAATRHPLAKHPLHALHNPRVWNACDLSLLTPHSATNLAHSPIRPFSPSATRSSSVSRLVLVHRRPHRPRPSAPGSPAPPRAVSPTCRSAPRHAPPGSR